jgi:hypothetical protein
MNYSDTRALEKMTTITGESPESITETPHP